MTDGAAGAISIGHSTRTIVAALRHELAEFSIVGERSAQCAMVALAVALATTVALWVRVDAAWWAAISAFVSTQASAPASLRRGILRILGTALGAIVAVLLLPWLVEDPVALSLTLLAASTVGVIGFLVSQRGYAWLLGAITLDMVLLAAIDDPLSALEVACNRTAEVTIGTLCAILVALMLAPPAAPAQPQATPGWSGLLHAQWPAVQQALCAGIGVMLVPILWTWLELPSLSQAAITVAAVMAVPALSGDAAANQQKFVERALHRILGCAMGGVAGLICLALSIENFPAWLAMLSAGIWIAAHVQGSQRGIGYVGTQGAVVFISTLVQGSGPPASIVPGLERFAGITGGLLILLALSILIAPSRRRSSRSPE